MSKGQWQDKKVIPHQNIDTDKGLDKLEEKAFYFGHYAESLQILELIQEIRKLREESKNLDHFLMPI